VDGLRELVAHGEALMVERKRQMPDPERLEPETHSAACIAGLPRPFP
jgi:hypothetical protein